eukprot:jgi/Phyca11/99493/e_gw1.3.1095.1
MMIFQNANSSYPVRGVPSNTPGVCYRTGPKGWMSKRVFREYLTEWRAMNADRRGRHKNIYLDNCSSQLTDSFVIAKIKNAWRCKWNHKRIELIENEEWQNTKRKDGSRSGKLRNPGERYFLSQSAECVREVNAYRYENGMNYARKAMIRCGFHLM